MILIYPLCHETSKILNTTYNAILAGGIERDFDKPDSWFHHKFFINIDLKLIF